MTIDRARQISNHRILKVVAADLDEVDDPE
jgi:hypothetical protein